MRSFEVVSPAPRDVWLETVASDPHALPSQTPLWHDAIVDSARWEDASRLYVTRAGRRLVLPAVRLARLTGPLAYEASPPSGWGFGGLVAERGLDHEDVDLVLAETQTRRGIRQTFRPNPLQGALWTPRLGYVSVVRCAHVLSLEGGEAGVWGTFDSEARRSVRMADRVGVEIESDASGRLLPIFFELLERSRVRWAAQQHEPALLARARGRMTDSASKWARIARHMEGACKVLVAWAGTKPAASIIVLQGSNAHYTRGAMDKDLASPTKASYAVQWSAIRDAIAAGARSYHMGDSKAHDGVARFKEHFGARLVQYHELRCERLPITTLDRSLRSAVKRVVGFRD